VSVASQITAVCQAAVPGREVYNAQILNEPDPDGWAIVYCNPGDRKRLTVATAGAKAKVWWQVSCFAPTEETAAWLQGRITDHLMANPVVIDGWTPGVVKNTVSQLPIQDESVMEHPLIQAISQFEIHISKY